MKIKTPEELAAKSSTEKKQYTLYLETEVMEYIRSRAQKADISASALVNEAITLYVEELKKRKS